MVGLYNAMKMDSLHLGNPIYQNGLKGAQNAAKQAAQDTVPIPSNSGIKKPGNKTPSTVEEIKNAVDSTWGKMNPFGALTDYYQSAVDDALDGAGGGTTKSKASKTGKSLADTLASAFSDKLKAKLYADGGVMMSNGYVDGKLYAIVLPIAYYDYIPVVSIRSDWLEECGLEAPKTMDDLWNIAKTFKDNNMGGTCTIGIGMTKNVTDVLTAGVGLLNGYHAYSNIWLEKDGELVNSNIQPEMKAALGALAEKYSEGLIDPEFGTKENAQIVEDIMAGRCGIVVSNFCAPFDLANAAADGQQWSFYAVPSVDGEPVLAQESANFTGGVVVSAKCEHPEAVIKLFNLFAEYEFDEKTGNNAAGLRNFAYPFVVDDINANYKIHNEYLQFLETGKTPETVTAGYDSTVEACEKYNKDGNMEGWSMYAIFGPDSTEALVNAAVEANGYLVSAYTGSSTESMLNYDSTLKTLTEQFITDVIRGVKTVDDFDDYVASWKANGGDKITEEVNAWYTAQ